MASSAACGAPLLPHFALKAAKALQSVRVSWAVKPLSLQDAVTACVWKRRNSAGDSGDGRRCRTIFTSLS